MVPPRKPILTYDFLDEYCQIYQDLFKDVRNFEYFKFLHIGILHHHRPKSFDGIAKIVGLQNGQRLKALFDNPNWNVSLTQGKRMEYIKQMLGEQEIILCINEWGVFEENEKIDYVCDQYLNTRNTIQKGIVSINSYAITEDTLSKRLCTLPLLFQVSKPQSRLKPGDTYKSKSQIAQAISKRISQLKFRPKLILTEKFQDDEVEVFAEILQYSGVPYILVIHVDEDGIAVPPWLNMNQQWERYRSIFPDYSRQEHTVRKLSTSRRDSYYYEVSRSSTKNPALSRTRIIKSNLKISDIREAVDQVSWWLWNNRFHERPLKTLGWLEPQITDYAQIERWWELIFSAYLLASLWSEQAWDRQNGIQLNTASTENEQKPMTDFPFGLLLERQLSIQSSRAVEKRSVENC